MIRDITIINISYLTDIVSLEKAINSFAKAVKKLLGKKNSKIINISRHSKSWWDINCSRDLEKYRSN